MNIIGLTIRSIASGILALISTGFFFIEKDIYAGLTCVAVAAIVLSPAAGVIFKREKLAPVSSVNTHDVWSILSALRWCIGFIVAVATIGGILQKDYVAAIGCLLIAIMLISPLEKIIFRKTQNPWVIIGRNAGIVFYTSATGCFDEKLYIQGTIFTIVGTGMFFIHYLWPKTIINNTYQNAYARLATLKSPAPMSEHEFYNMVIAFRKNYLITTNYHNRVLMHRDPDEVKNATANELKNYLLVIQHRKEMSDVNNVNNQYSSAPAVIADIWRSSRSIRSLYNAVKAYCLLRSKDFNVVAVHIAEYRGLFKLFMKLRPETQELEQVAKPAPAKKVEEPMVEVPEKSLEDLKDEFDALAAMAPQARGYAFQHFLNKLFSHFKLAPKTAFRNIGEEIDGSFDIDNNIYLVEAKWTAEPVSQAELLVFNSKVESKANWARGMFISYSGFSADSLVAFSRGRRAAIIGMNGNDIAAILDRKISLVEAIRKKARMAAETNTFFIPLEKLV